MNLNQVTVPALDVAASAAFYRRLGLTQIVGSHAGYARFECDGGATFSLHRVERMPEGPGAVVYFETERLDEEVRRLQAAGVVFEQLPRDEPWLWREARLRDPAGNAVCLYYAGDNRRNPPWRLAPGQAPGQA